MELPCPGVSRWRLPVGRTSHRFPANSASVPGPGAISRRLDHGDVTRLPLLQLSRVAVQGAQPLAPPPLPARPGGAQLRLDTARPGFPRGGSTLLYELEVLLRCAHRAEGLRPARH